MSYRDTVVAQVVKIILIWSKEPLNLHNPVINIRCVEPVIP